MADTIIQIIEDEPLHAMLLDRALRQAHFNTALDADGHTGWQTVQRLLPSLILLDLMLPGMNGREVCRLVRRTPSTRHIPIIMLTASSSEEDRIAGIDMGADDYVAKPFSPREIVSRVQAVLRRSHDSGSETNLLSGSPVLVEGPYFMVSLRGRQLTVSNMELALLRGMVAHERKLLTAEDVLAFLGRGERTISQEDLDQRVRFLRRKIENSTAGTLEILPGFRYRLLTAP